MNKVRTHYDNLKVARNAPQEVIAAAYRSLSKMYHPDTNKSGDAERIFKIINRAYEVLSDAHKRSEHDKWISEMELASDAERESEKAEPVYYSSDYIPPEEPIIKNRKKIAVTPKDKTVIKILWVFFTLVLGSIVFIGIGGGMKKKEEAPPPAPAPMQTEAYENKPMEILKPSPRLKKKHHTAVKPLAETETKPIFYEEKIDDTSEPEINVKNDSYKNLTLKLGNSKFEIPANEEIKVPFRPGKFSYRASAPNTRSKYGEINIKQGYRYSWKFWIEASYVP